MAIIGWLCLVAILGFISLAYGLAFLNNMGTYNIGGVPNSGGKKLITFIFGCIIGLLWWRLIVAAPFTITFGS